MKILYGTSLEKSINITQICLDKLSTDDIITIPRNDVTRAGLFTDPEYGVVKKIFIDNVEYDAFTEIKIKNGVVESVIDDQDASIRKIHSQLKMKHGSLTEELPEQKMAVKYLTGTEKVLEIGSNVGRNSLVIASILEDDTQLVTLECDPYTVKQLTENRDLNGFRFKIVPCALSKRKLIQRGWDTKPSETLLDGYTWVNTITFDELKKENGDFDTLVLDCEGAFYYILMDMPEILDNIKMIIVENDYHDFSHKQYVDINLRSLNFEVVYKEAGGWGPCYNCFYEVWKRD